MEGDGHLKNAAHATPWTQLYRPPQQCDTGPMAQEVPSTTVPRHAIGETARHAFRRRGGSFWEDEAGMPAVSPLNFATYGPSGPNATRATASAGAEKGK